MKYACQYAIIRFLPYVETGEFANVGIVLTCPQTGYFDFKLLRHRHRVNAFFEELDKSIFTNVTKEFALELKRLRRMVAVGDGGQQQTLALAKHLFSELVRPRESIIRFDELRAVLTDDPGKTMVELYDHYVERNFATKQYQEKLLERDVQKILRQHDLAKIYSKQDLSNPAYHVSFPFVKMVNDRATRIIKPLYLAHEDPTRLYDHGMAWVTKIQKLALEKLLPDAVLFAVEPPDQNKQEQFETFNQVKKKLENDVLVINYSNKEKLLEFAEDTAMTA